MELTTPSFTPDNFTYSTTADNLASYFNGSFDGNSTVMEETKTDVKVDYIGYVTTPLFFVIGFVGKICVIPNITLYGAPLFMYCGMIALYSCLCTSIPLQYCFQINFHQFQW